MNKYMENNVENISQFDVSNMRFQMNVSILKISPVFDDPKYFQKEMWSLMNQVYCGHKVISNDEWWFKGTDDPQVYKWQKVISDGSHDFDNPKAYGDTSIFDGLVQIDAAHVTEACLVWTPLITWN